jgi:hypothetical protein
MKKPVLDPHHRYLFRLWRRNDKARGRHLDRRVCKKISDRNTTFFFITPIDGEFWAALDRAARDE